LELWDGDSDSFSHGLGMIGGVICAAIDYQAWRSGKDTSSFKDRLGIIKQHLDEPRMHSILP
jgi:hypothetical protein